MQARHLVGAAFLLALICGCASVGRSIDREAVGQIREGETTQAEVRAALGPPAGIVKSNGDEVWTYIHARARVKGETFVPVLGLFAGGARSSSESVTITFGPDGVAERVLWSESRIDSGMGGGERLLPGGAVETKGGGLRRE